MLVHRPVSQAVDYRLALACPPPPPPTGIPNVLNQLGMSGSFLLGPLVVTQPSNVVPPSNSTGNFTGQSRTPTELNVQTPRESQQL